MQDAASALVGKAMWLSTDAPDGWQSGIFVRKADNTAVTFSATGSAGAAVNLPEAVKSVALTLYANDTAVGKPCDFALHPQLEEGTKSTAWERPDVVDYAATQSEQAQADEAMGQMGQLMADKALRLK